MQCFTISPDGVVDGIRVRQAGEFDRPDSYGLKYPIVSVGPINHDSLDHFEFLPVGMQDFNPVPELIEQASIIVTTKKGTKILVRQKSHDTADALVKVIGFWQVTTTDYRWYPCHNRGRGIPLHQFPRDPDGMLKFECPLCGIELLDVNERHPLTGQIKGYTLIDDGHGEPYGVFCLCHGCTSGRNEYILRLRPDSNIRCVTIEKKELFFRWTDQFEQLPEAMLSQVPT